MALGTIRKLLGDVLTSAAAGYLAGLVSLFIAGLVADVYEPLLGLYGEEVRKAQVLSMVAGIALGIALSTPYIFLTRIFWVSLLSWAALGALAAFFAAKGTDRSIFPGIEIEYGTYWVIVTLACVFVLVTLWRAVEAILSKRPHH